MHQQIFRRAFGTLILVTFFVTLAGCKRLTNAVVESDTGVGQQQTLNWDQPTGTILTLQAVTETYFKSSLELVRIKDSSGTLINNPAYTARKCGLRANTKIQFKFEQNLPTNMKYAIGEIVSIENPQQNTFDATANYCTPGLQGFVFKSDFILVGSNAGNKSGTVTATTTATQTSVATATQTSVATTTQTSTQVGTPTQTTGTVDTPNDAYIQERVTQFRTQGTMSYDTVTIRHAVYSLDGNVRISGQDAITKKTLSVFRSGSKTSDMTSKLVRTWEGTTTAHVLLPFFAPDIFADKCETRVSGGKTDVKSGGRGMTPCNIPADASGTRWLWVNCLDVACSANYDSSVFSMQ